MPKRYRTSYGKSRGTYRRGYKKRRMYNYRRKSGRFAGRYYRRVYRGGKWYRKYSRTHLTGVKSKHVRPMLKSADRGHFVFEREYRAQIQWTGASDIIATGFAPLLPFDDTKGGAGTGFPPTNFFKNAATTITDAGWNAWQGKVTAGLRYGGAYVTGMSVDWILTRNDQGDGNYTEIAMVPLSSTQILGLTPGTFPIYAFPGGNDPSAWANMKQLPVVSTSRLSSLYTGRPTARIRQYYRLKKHCLPIFPTGTTDYWYAFTNNGSGTVTTVQPVVQPGAGDSPFLWMGIFQAGSAMSILYETRVKVKFYMTFFAQNINYAIQINSPELNAKITAAEEKTDEKKEEKKDISPELQDPKVIGEDDVDEEDKDLVVTMREFKQWKAMRDRPSTPVTPATPIATSSISSASFISSLKTSKK